MCHCCFRQSRRQWEADTPAFGPCCPLTVGGQTGGPSSVFQSCPEGHEGMTGSSSQKEAPDKTRLSGSGCPCVSTQPSCDREESRQRHGRTLGSGNVPLWWVCAGEFCSCS